MKTPDIDNLQVYRMIPIQNLEHDLRHGLYAKKRAIPNPAFVSIGSQEIISRRDKSRVKCHPDSVINDYVPFYFSVRTPMLLNIKTGRGVPLKPQEDIVYLCCRFADLATEKFQWCFTDGNAAREITRFFKETEQLSLIDWHSIISDDFRDSNADGDEDRGRKKHAEFLVKDHVPVSFIASIVVKTEEIKTKAEGIINRLNLDIPVFVNPHRKFYFL